MYLNFDSEEKKQESVNMLMRKAKTLDASAIFVVSEAWMAEKSDFNDFTRPSEAPTEKCPLIAVITQLLRAC